MSILIYLIITILFAVLIFWTWNNTKEFNETKDRIKYIVIGIFLVTIVTTIIFAISKIGINYPKAEIMKKVRNIAILLFTPINGFLSLPHIATIKNDIKINAKEEKVKKKIIILGIIIIISLIVEINYLKDFQNGIIGILNSK